MDKPRGRPFEPGNQFGGGRRKGSRLRFPAGRGVPLSLKLPTIRSAGDAERAAEKVTEALHRGQCTPAEATESASCSSG